LACCRNEGNREAAGPRGVASVPSAIVSR
jgi:hypothetical protein